MQIKQKHMLWMVVALALIGCQRAAAAPTETTPPPQVRPSPTPLPLINGDSATVPTLVAPEIPRITIDELKALLSSARNVIVVDTRDPDAYKAAHIRGAINIPYDRVATVAPQLRRNAKIVLYCA